jgi:molybdate transport system substrate-binding protein
VISDCLCVLKKQTLFDIRGSRRLAMTIRRLFSNRLACVCFGFFLLRCATSPVIADEIRVYSGGAPQQVLRTLTPEFEQSTGHKVSYTFALVTVIQDKLAAGEKADLILLPVPLIAATGNTLSLRPDGRMALARVGIGAIVREGATKPDLSNPENVKTLLLNAQKIAFPEPNTPSGAHLQRVLDALGVAEAVRPKLQIKAAINGGAQLVANGDADVGMYLLSEVQGKKGISVVGLLPAPLQSFVVYGAAIPSSNPSPDAAMALLKFITDPAKSDAWQTGGFEIIPR